MNILVHTDPWSFWLPNGLSVLLVLLALYFAPWRELGARSIRLHLLLATVVLLGLFWVKVGVNVHGVYTIHPVLMSIVVVVFGLRLCLLAGLGAVLWMHVLSGNPWENIGWHFMVNVAVPAAACRLLLYGIYKAHIQNLFVFLLGGGFFGGAFSAFFVGASAVILLWVAKSSLLLTVLDNGYLFFLMMFPEGFINGALVTTIAVLRPDLVRSYNDKFYLDGK